METLKQKWGPLPVWGWLALITVILLGYYLWKQHTSGSTASTADQTASDTAPEIVVQTGGETSPDQSATPPGEPGFTAADQSELAGLSTQSKKEESQIAHLNRQTGIAPSKGKSNEKQIGKLNKRTGISPKKPVARKAPPKKPGPIRRGAGTTSARHLATSHPVQD